jgi:hypothetical protein
MPSGPIITISTTHRLLITITTTQWANHHHHHQPRAFRPWWSDLLLHSVPQVGEVGSTLMPSNTREYNPYTTSSDAREGVAKRPPPLVRTDERPDRLLSALDWHCTVEEVPPFLKGRYAW